MNLQLTKMIHFQIRFLMFSHASYVKVRKVVVYLRKWEEELGFKEKKVPVCLLGCLLRSLFVFKDGGGVGGLEREMRPTTDKPLLSTPPQLQQIR